MKVNEKVKESSQKIEIRNRKAYRNYSVLQKIEAGVSLLGSEIKSIRQGKISLSESWVSLSTDLQVQLEGAHISPYKEASFQNHDPLRPRKLLLHKKEIIKLANAVQSGGFSLVPLRIYEKRSMIKVEVGLVKGKKYHDKRESDKKSAAQKEIAQAMKKKNSREI